jgi:hypothetical protein
MNVRPTTSCGTCGSLLALPVQWGEIEGLITNQLDLIEHLGTLPLPAHNHNDLYYTQDEIDDMFAGIEIPAHNHDASYYTKAETDTLLGGHYTKAEVDDLIGDIDVTPAIIPTRAALAALTGQIAGASHFVVDTQGHFVFSTADHTANIAADPQQGIYVPGVGGTWVRATGPDLGINAAWYGLAPTATAAANSAALNNAFAAANALGRRLVYAPALAYNLAENVATIAGNDITFQAYGAVFTNAIAGFAWAIRVTGHRCKIRGGRHISTTSTSDPWVLEISGTDCDVFNVEFEKGVGVLASKYFCYVRNTASGFRLHGCGAKNFGGIFSEADQFEVSHNRIVDCIDDAVAIKGITSFRRNIRVHSNFVSNGSAICSIGSEVGTEGANDPAFSKGSGQISITGNTALACSAIALIKPGAVAADYRDGTVEDVVISNNTLTDPTGQKFASGIQLWVGRGARIFNVRGRNNVITARCKATTARRAGCIDFFFLNSGVGTAEPVISGVDLQIKCTDTYGGKLGGDRKIDFTSGGPIAPTEGDTLIGALSGATALIGKVVLTSGNWGGTAEGYFLLQSQTGAFQAEDLNLRLLTTGVTLNNQATVAGNSTAVATTDIEYALGFPIPGFVSAEQQTGGIGDLSNIVLDIEGNGCGNHGVEIQSGFDDQITFKRLKLKNSARVSTTYGSFYTASRVRLEEYTIEPFAGATFVLGGSGKILDDRNPKVQVIASAATVTPTFQNHQVNITAQAQALQFANPTGIAADGWRIVVRVKDNGTARAITYDTQYRGLGVALPATTVLGKTTYITMIYNEIDTKWDVVSVAQEA